MASYHPTHKPGRHFLQIPGPTNVPDRILRAIDRPTIDHRGKEFARLGRECLEGLKPIFKTTSGEVFIFPASGTGAWEAAIVNTLSPGLLYGLREAIAMVHEEGLENVLQRHLRLSEAARRAVIAWGLELLCSNPAEYSPSCTAVLLPDGFDETQFRSLVLEHYNLSLGAGLEKVAGRVFRIGHLGDLNDLMLCGALCGVEMGLARFGVPHEPGGVSAAMRYLGE
jgi:aspartate aminotransferase-like enzyme